MPKKPLHIVMLIDAWFPERRGGVGVFGGGQVHVRELTKGLTTKYHCKVAIFYPVHPNILIRALWSLYVIPKIITYAKFHSIDLIHSHGFNSAFTGKIVSLILKKPIIHTVHGSALIDQNLNTPKAWLEKWLLTKVKYSSEISVAAKFKSHPNVNTNISIIPNGVNVAEFDAVKVKKYSKPSLIWVGRPDKVKGLNLLKKAILKVRKQIPNLKTNLVSGGRLSGLSLIAAYKKAHVFVLPSLAEGQPLTLLEAWAAKLPVVVTAVGDNPLMVVDGVNGLLVEPGNIKQIADALVKILKNKELAKTMGMAGYRLVKHDYSWDRVVSDTYSVYQQVLGANYASTQNATFHFSLPGR